ncbi:acyl-CoA thioesterase [Aurantibacillus circumpalustris]|uniref:acyl-CoA thioesterase n=1 Tax=Aurantibacillus circumpalustris TaxID=3036359 RepID=UPI00295AE444|nr:thioesterase family protein [Aurantibacillus circumpalustris]
MPRSLTQSTLIHIRFSECDPLNIVWHGNYVKYFEDGREDFGRANDFSYLQIYTENGLSIPLVHLEIDYKRPVSFGETIRVETTLVDDPAAKIVFEYKIFNSKDEVLCTGKTIQAFVHLERKELQITMPDFFEAWKNKYLK